jgi:hypothetical protein
MVALDVIRAVGEQAFETLREVRAAARDIADDELASRVATGFVARQLDAAALVNGAWGAARCAAEARQPCWHGPIGWASCWPGAVWWANGRAWGGGSRYVGESAGRPSARASVIMRWS